MSKEEYYILKCPVCDENITKVMEFPDSEIICPNCKRVLNLYTIFGYNMWLSENGKSTKVCEKPIKDVASNVKDVSKYSSEFTCDEDDYEFDEEEIAKEYIDYSNLIQKRPETLHEILSFNADICLMQYRYLIKVGFTRPEAVEIIKKLIEQNFLL